MEAISSKGAQAEAATEESLLVVPVDSDEILAHAYLMLKARGRLGQVFTEDVPSLRCFVDAMIATPCLCAYRGKKAVGLGWAWRMKEFGQRFARAEVGIAFWEHLALRDSVRLGALMLEWIFRTHALTVAYATYPAPNRRIGTFLGLLGFQFYGPIPGLSCWEGKQCDAVSCALTAERWEVKKIRWIPEAISPAL